MEDILHLYSLPYDPKRPVICFDEVPYCLVAEQIAPQPMRSGVPAKEDYTYRRLGVWNLLVAFHPALGQRRLELHHRRTAKEYTATLLDFIRFRNRSHASVHWQFSPSSARLTLQRHYLSISF